MTLERNIIESIGDGFITLDDDFRFTFLNEEGLRMVRPIIDNAEATIGRSFWEVFPGSYHSTFGETYRRVMETGETERFEAFYEPLEAWFNVTAFAITGGIALHYRDTTEERRARLALQESESRRSRAMAAGRVGTWEYYPQAERAIWDPETTRIFGFGTSPYVDLKTIAGAVHPEDRERWEKDIEAALDPNGNGRHAVDIRIQTAQTVEPRWIEVRGQTSFEQGVPVVMHGTARDVTDRQRAESNLKLVNKELNHRVKNLFSVVKSLLSLSRRSHPEAAEFADLIGRRIDALAAAHLVSIVDEDQEPADFRDVIAAILRPYIPSEDRVSADGPYLLVPQKALTPLGLILNELATNAVKYGAWSKDEGFLKLSWAIETNDKGDLLKLHWSESFDGPRHEREGRRGLGVRLMRMSAQQLGGELMQEFEDGRADSTLIVPLSGEDWKIGE